MNTSILLIGKPHASKTVYLSQLYSRLVKGKSKLTLYKPVADLTPISAAREALANGEEPQTTPPELNIKFSLPIQTSTQKIDLLCPEYGGEQVINIVENRELSQDWAQAVKASNNWLLFIRLNSINKALDISDIAYSRERDEIVAPEVNYKISDQVFFIELLQILLQYKEYNYHSVNNHLKLAIVLTCWDEMDKHATPKLMLQDSLPLLSDFVNANWVKEKLITVGLSAQGFALDTPENQEKYQIEGPEEFGYLILPDGTSEKDITELLELALS